MRIRRNQRFIVIFERNSAELEVIPCTCTGIKRYSTGIQFEVPLELNAIPLEFNAIPVEFSAAPMELNIIPVTFNGIASRIPVNMHGIYDEFH